MKRTKSKLGVVALLAAATLAGCGGDDELKAEAPSTATEQASTPAPEPELIPEPKQTKEEKKISKTSKGKWAKEVCAAITAGTKPLQPPDVQQNDPGAVKQSVQVFFTSLAEQLEGQEKALDDLDSPPGGKKSQKAWEEALQNLTVTKEQIDKVRQKVADTRVRTSDDVSNMMGSVGEQMQAVTKYEGVVSDLLEDKGLQQALLAEPDCRKIAGAKVS